MSEIDKTFEKWFKEKHGKTYNEMIIASQSHIDKLVLEQVPITYTAGEKQGRLNMLDEMKNRLIKNILKIEEKKYETSLTKVQQLLEAQREQIVRTSKFHIEYIDSELKKLRKS